MLYNANGQAVTITGDAYDANGRLLNQESSMVPLYNTNKDLYFFQGPLHKSGQYLCKADGERASIRGIGTHALLQYSNLHTIDCFRSLRNLGFNLIRISVYLEDYYFTQSNNQLAYGYISKPDETKAEIEKIVNYCEQLGLYVLIDWHVYSWGSASGRTGTGVFHQTEAEAFFRYYTSLYANKPFVMWELANEPHHQTLEEYTPYLQTIRAIIKSNISNPVMVTGTCSVADTALWDEMVSEGMSDIFMSPHAYGADINSARYKTLIEYGIPIFNTEWGNCDGHGGTSRFDDGSTELIQYYEKNHIPNSIWKYTDQTYVCSLLKNVGVINNTVYSTGFDESDLTVGGLLHATWSKYYARGGT